MPQEDFAGGHPDPNLTYAHELVELMWKVGLGSLLLSWTGAELHHSNCVMSRLTNAG